MADDILHKVVYGICNVYTVSAENDTMLYGYVNTIIIIRNVFKSDC